MHQARRKRGRSIHPISTRVGTLSPPITTSPPSPRIFRPCDGPELYVGTSVHVKIFSEVSLQGHTYDDFIMAAMTVPVMEF